MQLYRPCGMASVLPTCRNMSFSRRRGGKRAALTSVCSCEARPSNIARGTNMSLMSFLCGLLPGRCGCGETDSSKRPKPKTDSVEVQPGTSKETNSAHESSATGKGSHTPQL